MSAAIVDIADAVVAVLNGASLSQSFTAVRYYVPVHDLRDLVDLTVSVVPASLTSAILTRSNLASTDYVIHIGIQKVIGQGPMTNAQALAAVDPLMQLVQEISDLFNGKPLVGYTAADCMSVENDPIYAPQHMDQQRVFTSVLALTFNMVRT